MLVCRRGLAIKRRRLYEDGSHTWQIQCRQLLFQESRSQKFIGGGGFSPTPHFRSLSSPFAFTSKQPLSNLGELTAGLTLQTHVGALKAQKMRLAAADAVFLANKS